jgi:hypothetical protein
MWVCATALLWLGCLGTWVVYWLGPKEALGVCLVCSAALVHFKLEKRARRYGAAANALNAAIAGYEASPDLTESALSEADRRAREMLRVERVRTAPAWICGKRRSYSVRIRRWIGPALLAWALLTTVGYLEWRWLRPWQDTAAGVLLFAGAMYGARKLRKARDILGEAIERYEFESAATESDLGEADRQASEVLGSPSRP